MNYDRILLELIDKMSSLEKRVKLLEKENPDIEEETLMQTQEMIRDFTKDDVISVIQDQLLKYDISVRKGSNVEGGGLFLTFPNGTRKHALLKLSRDYVPTNPRKFSQFKWRGWHRVVHEDTLTFDDYIFSIEHDGELDFFIMDQKQYLELTKGKAIDKNSNYYFYFVEDQQGNIYEDRDDINNMKPYFNNWDNFRGHEE